MSFAAEAVKAVRLSIEAALNGKEKSFSPSFSDPGFEEKSGVFVTLKKHEELRGCIGLIRGIEALKIALPKMARAAAFEDPRFASVKLEELDEIEIEISILSPMQLVKDIEDIKIGKHGLMLQMGNHSGLLLPQVPVEWNWNVNEFLHHLCLKAGLPPGSHLADPANLYSFSARIIKENDLPA